MKSDATVPPGYLTPVAYLWTRTVTCKNPSCGATVPLVRQTWLCKKKDRYVAMKMIADEKEKKARFEIVEAKTEKGLKFDPAAFSKGGNATCPFCGTVADSDYVKEEGCAGRMHEQMMAIVCTRPGERGKFYFSADDFPKYTPDTKSIQKRIAILCKESGLTIPNEPLPRKTNEIGDTRGTLGIGIQPYGINTYGYLFPPRQLISILTFINFIRSSSNETRAGGRQKEDLKEIMTYLGLLVDRLADKLSSLARWDNTRENSQGTFGRQALAMVWDYVEPNPFGDSSGGAEGAMGWIENVIDAQKDMGLSISVARGSATTLHWTNSFFDSVISDPPYYDNVPYADISDFFYIWLRRSIGHLYPEHFASEGTPKKTEAVADANRYGGSKEKARKAYEEMMEKSFQEANRVLKFDGQMTIVYAHKTTLGWSTLVDAMRKAGFTVTEAWPLDTEMKSRLRGMDSAALASSIFLVARKREGKEIGNFESDVKPELEQIVRERVSTLWDMGISGADLVIACVGAGLRAFTKYEKVEYANGDEVPAERFLYEVETAVLESILNRLSKEIGKHGFEGVDSATRFYILWRYTYRTAELDAGEAIVFANGTHVELDGQGSITQGTHALAEKKKGKYRLRDYAERGDYEKLGMPDLTHAGKSVSLVDALHRTLWLLENKPALLSEYLRESGVNREQLRLVAQALAGPALKGGGGEESDMITAKVAGSAAELSSLAKLLANWRSVIDEGVLTPTEQIDKKAGQKRLFDE